MTLCLSKLACRRPLVCARSTPGRVGAGSDDLQENEKANTQGKRGSSRYHIRVDGSERSKPGKGARRIGLADPTKTLELTLSLRGPKLPSADELADGPLTPAEFREEILRLSA